MAQFNVGVSAGWDIGITAYIDLVVKKVERPVRLKA